jgi:hypothetical protein
MTDALAKTRRAARWLRWLAIGLIVLVEAGFLLATAMVAGAGGTAGGAVSTGAAELAPWAGATSLLVFGLLVGIALVHLVRMLGRIERGALFATARELRGFSLWLFLAVLFSILAPPLLQLADAWFGGSGAHRATLTADSDDALMLLITGLLALIARLLEAAQEVADEAAQIV